LTYAQEFRAVLRRNKLLFGVITLVFVSVLVASAFISYAVLEVSPALADNIMRFVASARGFTALPPPFDLFKLIFLNNIGHFWNPFRVWVWIPLVGALSLGYELLLNAVLIGGVASLVSITRGPAYAAVGLLPHGVIEIPAFIMEFVALARWHVTTTRLVHEKMGGRSVDRPLLMNGLKDTVVMSVISVLLFAIAAYVESYITPRLLGLA